MGRIKQFITRKDAVKLIRKAAVCLDELRDNEVRSIVEAILHPLEQEGYDDYDVLLVEEYEDDSYYNINIDEYFT